MKPLLAEFDRSEALIAALRQPRPAGVSIRDACTPQPVEGLAEVLNLPTPHIRRTMLAAGALSAALLYLAEWWGAARDYPLDIGGRPLDSWSAFVIPCFEIGVLAAAIAGVAAFFHGAGLPRLHHPLFEFSIVARASQDRFLLIVEAADADAATRWLLEQGALAIHAAEGG